MSEITIKYSFKETENIQVSIWNNKVSNLKN